MVDRKTDYRLKTQLLQTQNSAIEATVKSDSILKELEIFILFCLQSKATSGHSMNNKFYKCTKFSLTFL